MDREQIPIGAVTQDFRIDDVRGELTDRYAVAAEAIVTKTFFILATWPIVGNPFGVTPKVADPVSSGLQREMPVRVCPQIRSASSQTMLTIGTRVIPEQPTAQVRAQALALPSVVRAVCSPVSA
jgi:hypothetical protein